MGLLCFNWGAGVVLLEQAELPIHHSCPSSQLTWTGFVHGEGFEDGEFWKVSRGVDLLHSGGAAEGI